MTTALALPFDATPAMIRAWRSSRAWRALARAVVHAEPACWLRIPGICKGVSTTADHVIPVATNPTLAMVRGNIHGACKPCNDWRQDMPIIELRRRIAAGDITPRTTPTNRTPDQARRRIASRRRTSTTATTFFAARTQP